jgi:hypothetical protein
MNAAEVLDYFCLLLGVPGIFPGITRWGFVADAEFKETFRQGQGWERYDTSYDTTFHNTNSRQQDGRVIPRARVVRGGAPHSRRRPCLVGHLQKQILKTNPPADSPCPAGCFLAQKPDN